MGFRGPGVQIPASRPALSVFHNSIVCGLFVVFQQTGFFLANRPVCFWVSKYHGCPALRSTPLLMAPVADKPNITWNIMSICSWHSTTVFLQSPFPCQNLRFKAIIRKFYLMTIYHHIKQLPLYDPKKRVLYHPCWQEIIVA